MRPQTYGGRLAAGFAETAPNFSPEGRRRRLRIGVVGLLTAAIFTGASVWLEAPWYVRLAVVLPAAVGTGSLLQVMRRTCVVHARNGTFEQSDMTVIPADPECVAASRRVAGTINRDAVLAGLLAAAIAAATAWIH